MKTSSFLYAGILCLALNACSQEKKHEEAVNSESFSADSTSGSYIPSSAAKEEGKDTTRKFIRTADIKFKVKNVVNATYAIENIIAKNDGFVTYTNLSSTVASSSTVPVSADSSLQSTFYSVENSITIRVPNSLLDTTLKAIARLMVYVDNRTIKAEDVALQLLSNRLSKQRTLRHEQRLINAIDNRGKKLKETTAAEEDLLEKQEQADNAQLRNLSLQDQISYSTVNLLIYQKETALREIIANDKNIKAYEPSFGIKVKDALLSGWEILEGIILILAKLWGVILVVVAAFYLYRLLRLKVKF